METRTMSSILKLACILVFLAGFATSDIDKDKEKCANQLVGLATCLPYVTGQAKSPQKECCTGLKQVIQNSPECMCLLVKDKDDPSLGFKINATLALSLPSQCQAPANASDCPRLLHLPPNSPDAKVFDDFANAVNKTNSSPAPGKNSFASSLSITREHLHSLLPSKTNNCSPSVCVCLCTFINRHQNYYNSLVSLYLQL
ncbi:non-specific lipid transfer protein GPI-anchored 14-like [Primulina huaijiensis]|uniref:non-specific lipid transfer protein GPI-anchored 14-like n=1 Tax=Primulina huaijiensis TaxID=1492673 RepID=UPI003CC736DD